MQKDFEEFARLLESHGYSGALRLIVDDLLPIARKHKISILEAAKRYVNCDEDQDTSFYQLGQALMRIGNDTLERLNIHHPLGK